MIMFQIDSWIAEADVNKDGVVSYDEFKQSLQKTISAFMSV